MKIDKTKEILSYSNNPLIIHIETATRVCSVALSKGNQLLSLKEQIESYSHAESLILFIEEVIAEHAYQPKDLSAICLSAGPGSYTGLRIGTATAKGLCYSLNIPLIAISSLESIFWGTKSRNSQFKGLFCPMIDARRMEVYTAMFHYAGAMVAPIQAKIIDENSFFQELKENKILFCGNGASKCEPILSKHQHASFDFEPISAQNMINIAMQKYQEQQFENIAYFEPLYLKEYIPGKSKVKGLD